MKILDKRLLALEKSFDFHDSDLSNLTDDQLEEKLEKLIWNFGYRRAEKGEVPEAELDRDKYLSPGPGLVDFSREEFTTHMRLGGYLPDENREEISQWL